jgi:DMSO/TMAO reductase YedYZ molybdopterin-dependent catalytic subunit
MQGMKAGAIAMKGIASADPACDSTERKASHNGAPLRLVAPVKLGLKNIKAITRITYTKDEPPDYWARRGYPRYDGI